MRTIVIVGVVAILVGDLGFSQENAPNLKDPKTIAAGHDLFLAKQCAHCHGPDGKGGINLARRELDPKGVFRSIAEGRDQRGLRMPPWRGLLTDEEIWQVTAYVMSISHHPK